MQRGARRRLLIAETPEALPYLRLLLGTEYDLLICTSLYQVLETLSYGDVDMILCGLHFDEDRMLELLRLIKSDTIYQKLPILCINADLTTLSDTLVRLTEMAIKASGADGFLDIYKWKTSLGEAQAAAKLQFIVRQILFARSSN